MGRREPRQRFMPNVWVFPGGRVDVADRSRAVLRDLRPEVAARLETLWSPGTTRALAVAAVRETFEETGLAFGELHAGELCPALDRLDYVGRAITPSRSPVRYHARFFSADAEHATGTLGGSGELLDLRWVKLHEALALPIIDATEFVLGLVIRRAEGRACRGLPLFSYRNGVARVRYQQGGQT